MNFQEFVNLTRPVIGGKSSSHKFVRTLFDAILSDSGRDILDDYSENTYKAYGNGRTQITKIAQAIGPHIDPVEFATFIYQIGESAQLELCERFSTHLPSINVKNVGDELADLFADIIREAAGAKRKSAPKGANADNNSDNTAGWTTLSSEDLAYLKNFRADSRDILIYIIKNDPSAGPTDFFLSDRINDIIEKWQFSVREIENNAFRKLVLDILNTLGKYTYYISDVFLRYIPERGILWFRNESWEEGNRLREELQPKSYELRCKIARLYEKLYPIPEDADQDRSETIEAEVVDDEEPSGTTEGKKTTVIQQQTNVIQNGENNFNLTNNGTMNFDLKGGGV